MKFVHTMALATMMVLAVTSGAVAQSTQPAANTPKPEKYKDWDLFCPKPVAANAPQVCQIRTVILSSEKKPRTRQVELLSGSEMV